MMKRFYKGVAVAQGEGGFRVLLDGRPVKTPARNTLAVPTRALAETIAAEWRAQQGEILPLSMPFLRLADTVIDGVVANRAAVIDAVLRFGEHDLLYYRAGQPPDLAQMQREGWDPVLAWAENRYGARFTVTTGLEAADQPPETLAALRGALEGRDGFTLTGLHVVASITGSLLLALALAEGESTPAHVFALSRLDEDYQAAKWGRDAQAQTRAAALAHELDKAAEFIAAAATAI